MAAGGRKGEQVKSLEEMEEEYWNKTGEGPRFDWMENVMARANDPRLYVNSYPPGLSKQQRKEWETQQGKIIQQGNSAQASGESTEKELFGSKICPRGPEIVDYGPQTTFLRKPGSGILRALDDAESERLEPIINATFEKVKESQSLVKESTFDYFVFQKAVQLEEVGEEAQWMECQVAKENKEEIEWKPTTIPTKAQSVKKWEALYGPINSNSATAQELLNNFAHYLHEAAQRANENLEAFWSYRQRNGLEKCLMAVRKYYTEQRNLLVPNGFTLEQMRNMRKDNTSLYNVNPVTSVSHLEWFLVSRFHPALGASNVTIRSGNPGETEKEADDDKVVVSGYWPALMDRKAPRNPNSVAPEKPNKVDPSGEKLDMLKRLWNKMVALVQYEGLKIRHKDLQPLLWCAFKVNLEKTVTDLGFSDSIDFIQWARVALSENGKKSRIEVEHRPGWEDCKKDPFPFLVWIKGEEC